ncbi:hypothetical protein [Nocardia pseudovaccinii]|nr:hypothetical protein [Nocardia pseudovaccinii]
MTRLADFGQACIPLPGDPCWEWIALPRNGFLLAMGEVVSAVLGVPWW